MWPFRWWPTTTKAQADLLYGWALAFLFIVCLLAVYAIGLLVLKVVS